jgi:hypothetical protein
MRLACFGIRQVGPRRPDQVEPDLDFANDLLAASEVVAIRNDTSVPSNTTAFYMDMIAMAHDDVRV